MAFADIRSEIPRTFFHILGGLFLAWIGFSVYLVCLSLVPDYSE